MGTQSTGYVYEGLGGGVCTVISLSATDQLHLCNVTATQLTANDFIFA